MCRLFAVGDDWQLINRFAGADLVGDDPVRRLVSEPAPRCGCSAFRSPQSICHVSSEFVGKNPAQLSERVLSSQPEFRPGLTAVAVGPNTQSATIIGRHLTRLDTAIGAGTTPSGRGGRASVYILGRYRKVKVAVQPVLDREWDPLDVRFNTMHGAKGKGSRLVILAGMVCRGMPSTIQDDPLLQSAVPAGDTLTGRHHAPQRS